MSDWTPFGLEERERRGRVAHAAFQQWRADHGFSPPVPWDDPMPSYREALIAAADAVARDAVAGALREEEARADRLRGTAAPGLDSMTFHRNAAVADVLDEVHAMLAAVEDAPAPPEGEGK